MVSIAQIIDNLPEGYETAAKEQKAIIRHRGINSAGDLMMLSLFHLLNGCSLLEISEIARLTKMGEMSDVAFMNRFAGCSEWFSWIGQRLLNNGIADFKKPEAFTNYKVVAVDASDVREKGRSGRLYHFHYALDIFSMKSEQYKITEQKTGETLTNFIPKNDWLILGDRAYGTLTSAEHCIANKANFILRLKHKAFKLYDENMAEIDLLEQLKDVDSSTSKNIPVFVKLPELGLTPMRVCATKIPDDKLPQTERRIKRRNQKKQMTASAESVEMQKYVVLITALPETIPASEIISLYRYRWQVELYFKRLKGILDIGELPKKRDDSVKAWLQGKIMLALLIEATIAKASFFPKEHTG
jgi:transposase